MTATLLVIHATVGALWFGAMAYSLFVVQPRLARMVGADPVAVEDAQRELAQGNRWPVAGLIAVLWLSGVGLMLLAAGDPGAGTGVDPGAGASGTGGGTVGDGGWWWWAGVTAKAVLLGAATGLFWWVSWRGWPRRVFALPAELPGVQRQFRLVALTMAALVGAAFVLGIMRRVACGQ